MDKYALLRRFPMLDLTWSDEVQEQWWRLFRRLLALGLED